MRWLVRPLVLLLVVLLGALLEVLLVVLLEVLLEVLLVLLLVLLLPLSRARGLQFPLCSGGGATPFHRRPRLYEAWGERHITSDFHVI